MDNAWTMAKSQRNGKTPFWGCGGCGFARNFADRGKCWKCGTRGPDCAVAAEKLCFAQQDQPAANVQVSRVGGSTSTWTPGPRSAVLAPWHEGQTKAGAVGADLPKPGASGPGAARETTEVEKTLEVVQLCEKQGMGENDAFLRQARQRLEDARMRRDAAKPIRFRIRDAEARLGEQRSRVQAAQEQQVNLQEQLRAAADVEQKASAEVAALSGELAKLRLEQAQSAGVEASGPSTPQSMHAAVCALVPTECRTDPAVSALLEHLATLLGAQQQSGAADPEPPIAEAIMVDEEETEKLWSQLGEVDARRRHELLEQFANAKAKRARTCRAAQGPRPRSRPASRSPRRGAADSVALDDLISGSRSRQ